MTLCKPIFKCFLRFFQFLYVISYIHETIIKLDDFDNLNNWDYHKSNLDHLYFYLNEVLNINVVK
jgi:hypothetical protein